MYLHVKGLKWVQVYRILGLEKKGSISMWNLIIETDIVQYMGKWLI